jgi:myo-inositol-1(or 4)-monophosphatase
MDLHQLLNDVSHLSKEVATWIAAQRVHANDIESKALNNLVSFVDKGAEQQFVDGLSKLLPESGFIAEEGTGTAIEGGYNWIIDPLDGTTNYLHGVPMWCTSVALEHRGELLLGVICDVNHSELYTASKGGGSFLNGKSIRVSATSELKSALIGTGFPYYDFGRQEAYLKLLGELTRTTRGIRRPGSAALDLAYVACGRFDAFYEYALHPWDVAAGILLVREAGGRVTGFRDETNPLSGEDIIAGNQRVALELQAVIGKFML